MAVDKTKIKLKPCAVNFNSSDLGATEGGVTINQTVETVQVKYDQELGQEMGEIVTRHVMEVTAKFLQPETVLALLAPTAGENLLGTDLMSDLKTLTVAEIGTGGETWTFSKVRIDKNFSLNKSGTALQAVDGVKFICYPDPTTGIIATRSTGA